MIDIEERVADALRADAEGACAPAGLGARAMARATMIRRRRRVYVGTALVAVAAASALALPQALVRGGATGDPNAAGGGGPAPATAKAIPIERSMTTLPALPTTPPADEQPALVGTDPHVLHFDIAPEVLKADVTAWTTTRGYESVVALDRSGLQRAELLIGRDAAALDKARTPFGPGFIGRPGAADDLITAGPATATTVAGRPATTQRVAMRSGVASMPYGRVVWILRWQPVDGLHALAQAFDQDQRAVLNTAAALRLDRSQRCAIPARLATEPAGAVPTTCVTAIRRTPIARQGVWVHSETRYARGNDVISVWTEAKQPRKAIDTNQFVANHTVAGHPAQWRAKDPRGLWILDFGLAEVFISGTSERESLTLASGLTLAPNLREPATWR